MTIVLIHGGGFAGSCWEPMLPFLRAPALALDLPGRGDRPADLATVTLADFVDAVVDELVSRDLRDVVLVGHSLAGVTLPGVAAAVPERLRRLVFVSASVPPDGSTVADVLGSLSPATGELAARLGDGVVATDGGLNPELATVMFCNDMSAAQTARTLELMGSEAFGVIIEPFRLGDLGDLPITYVRLLQDQSLSLATQDTMIANLGGPARVDVVDLDAAHMAMISRPAELAAVLDGLDAP
jgi:pimeloyl-ACP methyl ester carboxylesterase